MTNKGAYFTVDISVGTPAQKFEVVADTGSDSVIVPSCICVDLGKCPSTDACFRGTNKSSTFVIPKKEKDISAVVLAFGSGEIDAIIATDVIKVGDQEALMKDGLLLMISRALNFGGPFEGILGLGMPDGMAPTPQNNQTQNFPSGAIPKQYSPKHFLGTAGVSHFSICFQDDGKPGVLRLGGAPAPDAIATAGGDHWSLGLQGIAVGKASAPVRFCDSAAGGESCSAVLDSGTTVMMGPKDHVGKLLGAICDAWPRCSSLSPGNSGDQVLQELLLNCTDWLTEDGLEELPPIHFLLAGPDGKARAVELSAWGYVQQTMQEETLDFRDALGLPFFDFQIPTGKKKKVCMPSFGIMEELPGSKLAPLDRRSPEWIIGAPFFYEYEVGHDMAAEPPAISLTPVGASGCRNCETGVGLVEHARPNTAMGARASQRLVRGPLRLPKDSMRKSATLGNVPRPEGV